MAPRSQLVLAVAVLFAALQSSCLLFTDTEVAQPETEDTGIEDATSDSTDGADTVLDDIPDDDGATGDITEEMAEDLLGDDDGGAGDVVVDAPTDRGDLDTGELDHGDTGPEHGTLRCANRIVETYDGELEAWEETEICAYEERCIDGACVDRPAGFGDACDGSDPCTTEELDCFGELCLTREPSAADGPCIGDEECDDDLFCSRRGVCQDGGPGDGCVDVDDCDPDLAPFCEDDVCTPAGVGEACTGDETCESDALYCDPDGFCRAGVEGDPCANDDQCAKTDRYCGPDDQCHDGSTGDVCNTTAGCAEDDDICEGTPLAVCHDRGEGDVCTDDTHCPSGLYCAESQSECRDGSTADHCDDTADCDETDDICKGEPDTTCQNRVVDDACSGDDDECPGALYCANDICQAGGTGAYCDATTDCTELDDICAGSPQVCRDRVLGDACIDSNDECPGDLYCSNSLCQAGDLGQFCNTTDDCVDAVNLCKGSPLRCQKRIEGDACGVPEDCPDTIPICSTDSVCQDGSVDDTCTAHSDCIDANHCDEYVEKCAEDLDLAADCTDDYQCVSDNCSNQHCAPVVAVGEATSRFAYIPAGTFCMGSPGGGGSEECPDGMTELGRDDDEGPLHQVTLTRGFYLQETEVTQRQWVALGFTNPSEFDECGLDCPVEFVNWWEAVAYVNAFSESEGLEECYTLEECDPSQAGKNIQCSGIIVSDLDTSGNPYLCDGYRLPTEAEWEYAYRAGTTAAFHNGEITNTALSPLDENLDLIGWYGGNSGVSYSPGFDCSGWYVGSTLCGTHEVGEKAPNHWGLYDMAGNVWEWVWDFYDANYYTSSPSSNPLGGTDSLRGHRGGSWRDPAFNSRAAHRGFNTAGAHWNHFGFRPARTIWPPHCSNDVQDGDESAIDCGGSCPGCFLAEDCYCDSDCASNNCSNAHCAPLARLGNASAPFRYIPPGTFCMGSPDGDTACMGEAPPPELGYQVGERPMHEVTLTRAFFLQATEVTHQLWEATGFTNPSNFTACGPDCPVEQVNWWEAVAFVNYLSEAEGLTPCYTLEGTCDPNYAGNDIECSGITVSDPGAAGNPYNCEGYRLPIEAEWEHAYRAGTRAAFYNGGFTVQGCDLDPNLDAIGWYCGNSDVTYDGCVDRSGSGGPECAGAHPAAGKAPNLWGLYDMAGNVHEWVWDPYDGYLSGSVEDPLGVSSSDRGLRGGSWAEAPRKTRGAARIGLSPGSTYDNLGLRVARTAWPAHCYNNVQDNDESDVDCGGSCQGCPVGD